MIGTGLSIGFGFALSGLLFGIVPTAPQTYLLAAAGLLAVAMAASLLPAAARRASTRWSCCGTSSIACSYRTATSISVVAPARSKDAKWLSKAMACSRPRRSTNAKLVQSTKLNSWSRQASAIARARTRSAEESPAKVARPATSTSQKRFAAL